MSHPELVFPVGDAQEARSLLGCDGLLHPEPVASGPAVLEPQERNFTVDPALSAWAGRLHG